MRARDIMTAPVVTVGPDTAMRKIAELLLEKGISAVPVVDESGEVAGMVSEGDLLRKSDSEREARRDWWLALLAEGEPLSENLLAMIREANPTARQMMSAPVITVTEDADVTEIGQLLAAHRIKRVPVLRDGLLVGVVSRADLVRAIAMQQPEPAPPSSTGRFNWAHRRDHSGREQGIEPGRDDSARTPPVTAETFRDLAMSAEQKRAHEREAERQAEVNRRHAMMKDAIDHHVSDEQWRHLLHEAQLAAVEGAEEYMVLRFPSSLCSDGGRAINVPEPDWPATLRGEAAETYLRFERDLKPRGFHLIARVLDFPEGFLGDIGLFLHWGGRHL